MFDVMLDLETMGTSPRAAIVAIGAVEFDVERLVLGRSFYTPVDLESSVSCGGEMSASTVMWWLSQGDEARQAITAGGVKLPDALRAFAVWMRGCGDADAGRVWGNGVAFDNVILGGAYQAAGMEQPWRFWNDRCYRTVKAMHPDILLARSGVHHKAVDDAHDQANHLLAMLGRARP